MPEPDKNKQKEPTAVTFTSADQLTPDEWVKRHQINFQDAMTALDIMLDKCKVLAPEGWGLDFEVGVGDIHVIAKAVAPAPTGGYGGGSGKPPFKKDEAPKALTLQTVQQAVTPYQDKLSIEEKEGKIIVKPKKFLGDEWAGINKELQKAGMTWGKLDPNDSKSGAWQATKAGA